MKEFLLYSIVGLAFFWAMAVSWSVSAGPASIAVVIEMLLASLLAATAGIWLFHRKAGAVLTVVWLSFFVIWPPIWFAVHGLGVGDAAFYISVLVLFGIPIRVLIRSSTIAESQLASKRQLLIYSALASVSLLLSALLSIQLWGEVFSAQFWENVVSHPDVWGLKTR